MSWSFPRPPWKVKFWRRGGGRGGSRRGGLVCGLTGAEPFYLPGPGVFLPSRKLAKAGCSERLGSGLRGSPSLFGFLLPAICLELGLPNLACLPIHPPASRPARQRGKGRVGGTGSSPAASCLSSTDVGMRPSVLFVAFLWLRGFLAKVRWALGAGGQVGPCPPGLVQAPTSLQGPTAGLH